MPKPRILCVVGTRPDAIKSAPVVLELHEHADLLEPILVSTGQHREMLDQALAAFDLRADEDLGIMQPGQSLAEISSRALSGLDAAFDRLQPDYVMAQGDTSTTFIASLLAFYRRLPFGHIEAGLRTDDIHNPFPEEFNRRASALVSYHHFAPTDLAAENLLNEGVRKDRVYVTGNTGIDAVLAVAGRVEQTWYPHWPGRVVLLTTHRRENWGEPQKAIARSIWRLVHEFEDLLVVVPMHKNPQVRETLTSVLGGHERIALIEPPDYARFVKLMQRSTLILTDSGGVQEEAPSFGIPVLVLRETTERPEGVSAGTAKLIGTDETAIYTEARSLLTNPSAYESMAHSVSPYGDGKAATRIVSVVMEHFELGAPEVPMWG